LRQRGRSSSPKSQSESPGTGLARRTLARRIQRGLASGARSKLALFLDVIQTPIQLRAAQTRPSPSASPSDIFFCGINTLNVFARFGNLQRPDLHVPQRLLAISRVLSRHNHCRLGREPGLEPAVAWPNRPRVAQTCPFAAVSKEAERVEIMDAEACAPETRTAHTLTGVATALWRPNVSV
jgi:hypothetical protein